METKTCFRHTLSEIFSGTCSHLGFDLSKQWSSLDSSTSFEACSSEPQLQCRHGVREKKKTSSEFISVYMVAFFSELIPPACQTDLLEDQCTVKREDIVTYLMLLLSTLRCVLTIKQANFPGSVLHDARKARPPQESRSEVSSSGLLHFPPKGSLITADGARAFPNACQNDYSDKKFLFAAVNHQKNIFTKRHKYRQTLWGKRNRVTLLLELSSWIRLGVI